MSILSISRLLSALFLLSPATVAQIPSDLPVDDATKNYLETLPPDKLAAILNIYGHAIAGQVPAPPELIQQRELDWSYEWSPPVYPTREFFLALILFQNR